jgi:hypothetical protein
VLSLRCSLPWQTLQNSTLASPLDDPFFLHIAFSVPEGVVLCRASVAVFTGRLSRSSIRASLLDDTNLADLDSSRISTVWEALWVAR